MSETPTMMRTELVQRPGARNLIQITHTGSRDPKIRTITAVGVGHGVVIFIPVIWATT